MNDERRTNGSVQAFDASWSHRKEASYNHWSRYRPQNQIQLAFLRHWILFQELMGGQNYQSCLEVGCGRGSISSYFAENGFECTLLDSSAHILNTAKNIFKNNGHNARFVNGDALKMPFDDNSFDVVVSIGLLEHFNNIDKPVFEQLRVLRPGGMFLGYIVPERPFNIQRYFNWINKILAFFASIFGQQKIVHEQKSDIYRSDYGSERYLHVIKSLPVKDIGIQGVYPLPMISHSPEFPFSLLPPPAEKVLVRAFEAVLLVRRALYKKNPWICKEKLGQAFLVTFKKV